MDASGGTVTGSKLNGAISDEFVAAAEEAGLQYVSDERPGYGRKAKGRHFDYFDSQGKPIRDEQRLFRIKRLASNTVITSTGARYAIKTSSIGSPNLPKRSRISGVELPKT
jgi:hypothetical protein